MILAGDIGGTSTRLATFAADGGGVRAIAKERYRSHDYAGLAQIVAAFTAAHPEPVEAACFGIAGPVIDGRVVTPNLPWVIESAELARQLRLAEVILLNDLEANAWGVFTLGTDDVVTLAPGRPLGTGNAAIIAAGTGLGEAGYHALGERLIPFASEGGHADFSPHDELTIDLLRWLQKTFGHVSWERVVSGPGLANIYEFLRGALPETPDPAAAISQAALAGTDPIAVRALDLFVALYGAEAGNLALKMKATRGVWIGGGIAPKILPRLKQPGFLEAFTDKGRFRPFLEAIPVRVITNDETALRGAGFYALSSRR
ncbi:MAG TPA: glucokinase [Candidatus Polarisedimenticolaceae bacterium]|nr:glucokinase [Candidatus Polarisedimenticolaceae bacterium]